MNSVREGRRSSGVAEGESSKFSLMMQNPVSSIHFDSASVAGTTMGDIDDVSYVDGLPGLFASVGPARVPLGAPLAISGWAVDPTCNEPPAALAVVVDAKQSTQAEVGFGRYDVKAMLGEETPEKIGFRAIVSTEMLAPGAHDLRVYALGGDGAWYDAARLVFSVHRAMRPELGVSPQRVSVYVDALTAIAPDGTRGTMPSVVPFGHFISVSGWAINLETKRAPTGVCVVDDAGGRWNGACDVTRPDARAAASGDDERLGFDIVIPSGALGRGRHVFTIWAVDSEGRRLGVAADAKMDVCAPVRPFPGFARRLDEPARRAAMLNRNGDEPALLRPDRTYEISRNEPVLIEGWALASEDAAPDQIVLELQARELDIPPLRYYPISGYHRTKVPRLLPDPPRDDAWFQYRLDAMNLPLRNYTLCVAVITADGCSYARGELGILRVVAEGSTGSLRRT